jgi:nitroimidazol reductase NimA-like FMN-containing flavoprotein (pyridoxamine 5'-phosphate oxidase superfamily)
MPKGQELDVLNRRQCLDLLQGVRVGRLVFTEDALPAVQPVNFRLWRDDVVFRVAGGAKLAAATHNQVVAFEADELDPDLRTGWSVTVVGHAQQITDVDELVEVAGTFVQPWVDGRRDHFVNAGYRTMWGRQAAQPRRPKGAGGFDGPRTILRNARVASDKTNAAKHCRSIRGQFRYLSTSATRSTALSRPGCRVR